MGQGKDKLRSQECRGNSGAKPDVSREVVPSLFVMFKGRDQGRINLRKERPSPKAVKRGPIIEAGKERPHLTYLFWKTRGESDAARRPKFMFTLSRTKHTISLKLSISISAPFMSSLGYRSLPQNQPTTYIIIFPLHLMLRQTNLDPSQP